jgi:hypothetical protein
MGRKHSRTAAVALAVAAGALAAFALRPAAGTTTATLAARNPAVEVRTQVIRRTIHVIRHEPGAALRGSRGPSSVVAAGHGPSHGRARTAASGGHRSTSSPAAAAAVTRASGARGQSTGHTSASVGPVVTHASGSHSSAPAPAGHPVSTRTSGSHSSAPAPASRPVSTRTSGSHGTSPARSSARPITRSSGASHRGGDDGGGSGDH